MLASNSRYFFTALCYVIKFLFLTHIWFMHKLYKMKI